METSKNEVNNKTKKDWINPNEVNKEFGFSISTLAKWRADNKNLNFYKMGKYIKYKRADIIEFIESHKIAKVA